MRDDTPINARLRVWSGRSNGQRKVDLRPVSGCTQLDVLIEIRPRGDQLSQRSRSSQERHPNHHWEDRDESAPLEHKCGRVIEGRLQESAVNEQARIRGLRIFSVQDALSIRFAVSVSRCGYCISPNGRKHTSRVSDKVRHTKSS